MGGIIICLAGLGWAPNAEPLETDELKKGRELAHRYCQGCHLFAEAGLLDKRTWKTGVLPLMTSRLGIAKLDPENNPDAEVVLSDWKLIWDYYLQAAPAQALPQPAKPKIQIGLKQFKVVNPGYRPHQAFVTLLRIDPKNRQLYVGNAQTKTLDVLNSWGEMVSSLEVASPPVSLSLRADGWYATLIGLVPPSDQTLGELVRLSKGKNAFAKEADLLRQLPRPTDATFADLNGDGREDVIISGFGNITGRFSWFENLGQSRYREHVLLDRPGAVRSAVWDFNRDGRPDIAVLMAQAKEGIFLLLNRGQDRFEEVALVEKHPLWGFTYFELIDFNRDGFIDLLAANGDNGEYPSCVKNYHGVRLYLNDGALHFREAYFYPLHGAFKAVASDYDLDGDDDFACISFFPDFYRSPEESFVYLENQGQFQFTPHTFTQSASGRWLTLDAGDLDEDGDPDIVLGASNRSPYQVPPEISARWEQEGPTILILRNQIKP